MINQDSQQEINRLTAELSLLKERLLILDKTSASLSENALELKTAISNIKILKKGLVTGKEELKLAVVQLDELKIQLSKNKEKLRLSVAELKLVKQELANSEAKLRVEILNLARSKTDLAESDEKLSSLLANIPDPIDIVDQDLNVLWVSEKLKAALVKKGIKDPIGKKMLSTLSR
ncbi:hypothetical protein KKE33_04670 [Patescibacteria group bacterium]|nr:hypothetical protein [Patescibacteria group bacterium]